MVFCRRTHDEFGGSRYKCCGTSPADKNMLPKTATVCPTLPHRLCARTRRAKRPPVIACGLNDTTITSGNPMNAHYQMPDRNTSNMSNRYYLLPAHLFSLGRRRREPVPRPETWGREDRRPTPSPIAAQRRQHWRNERRDCGWGTTSIPAVDGVATVFVVVGRGTARQLPRAAARRTGGSGRRSPDERSRHCRPQHDDFLFSLGRKKV